MNPETPQAQVPSPVAPSPINPSTAPQAPVQFPTSPTTPITAPKKSKKWKIIGGIAALLAVLAIVGVLAAASLTSGPTKISDAFVTDLKTGMFDAAQSLESQTMKQAVTVDAVAAAWKDTGFPNTKYTVIDKLVQTQSGKQYASVVYKADGVTDKVYLHVTLVKNDGVWQVLSFQADSSTVAAIK